MLKKFRKAISGGGNGGNNHQSSNNSSHNNLENSEFNATNYSTYTNGTSSSQQANSNGPFSFTSNKKNSKGKLNS